MFKNVKIVSGNVYKKFDDEKSAFREYYFLKNLSHPNITKLAKNWDKTNEKQIVMEFSGDSLSFGKEGYPDKIKKIDRLLLTMVDVLLYLRAQNIVHNDIKPSNITKDSGKFTLIDFGSAVLVSDNEKFTVTSYTIPYAAPEILTNSLITDPFKIDIWSLGITIMELLLGKNILDGDKAIPVFRNMLKYFSVNEETMSRLTFPEINVEKYCRNITVLPQFYEKFETDLAKIKKLDLLKDLLSNMLIMNPDRRYGLEDILKHGYFNLINISEQKKYTNTFGKIIKNLPETDLKKLYG